ncbi:MAG TPA: uracil-DNA glycosylase [Acidobacteriaceae bacterium]|nr:uracil-DNA glycosylase [Acidobacteriaceae bacterium]
MQKRIVSGASALVALNARITTCEKCVRLREHSTHVAAVKRRAYFDCEYWGRPVPSFGDPDAALLIVGLAPGAHGSNRTGRPFTGDGSGNFLYPVLYKTGFASQPESIDRNDGMRLRDLWITAVVRCAPPGNKPLPDEIANCAPYLDDEVAALKRLRVAVCLGKIAFDGFTRHLLRAGHIASTSKFRFAHGAEYTLPNGLTLLASYHPSLQNTNTGKLTEAMLLRIFRRSRGLAQQ